VQAGAELRKYQEHLEELVEERTAELRESEERYRTLFDGVPVGLYRSTPAGQMVDANLALVHMLGYPSREDLLAISPASLYVTPEDRVRWQALMEREGVVRDFEEQIRRRDGTVIWLRDTARAVKDEQGQVLYYEGSTEDITERRRAEEELHRYRERLEELVEERTAELRASEERYRTLFDGVPVGLYRSTPSGELMDANLALVEMMGYPDRDTVLEMGSVADVYVEPDQVQAAFLNAVQVALGAEREAAVAAVADRRGEVVPRHPCVEGHHAVARDHHLFDLHLIPSSCQ